VQGIAIPLKFLDVVGRQAMRSDGVYVDGSIQGIKVTFTADTGAARTVISTKLFRKIPNSKKPRSGSEPNLLNRGLSPITLDESSTSCFVLSGSEPNLLNRGLSPITLDESSTSPLIV
jgi:hypothetical protein